MNTQKRLFDRNRNDEISSLMNTERTPIQNVARGAGRFMQTLATGKPPVSENDDIMEKLKYRMIENELVRDPLSDRLKEAQIGAYESMSDATPPEGFVRVGNKIEKDPTYQDPNRPLPPSIEARKIKATEGLYDTVNAANLNYDRINRGIEAAPGLPQGLFGKAQTSWMKMFDSKNPKLSDWQTMKSLLTDAQLQKTAKTKGAISDREMAMFAEAVANDDFSSVARQTNVLDAFKKSIFADQDSKVASFKRSFNEDPSTWEDLNIQNPFLSMKPDSTPALVRGVGDNGQMNQKMAEYSSPAEADNAGLAPGTIVMVQGRRYQI